MRKPSGTMLLVVFCVGLLFVTHDVDAKVAKAKTKTKVATHTEKAKARTRPKLTRQQAIEDFDGEDPFPIVQRALNNPTKYNKLVSTFDSYLESASAEDGMVKTRSDQILKVLGAVGTATTKLKSDDGLKVLSGLLDILAVGTALIPGGQPFAIVFSMVSLGLGFADKSKSESEKMQAFFKSELQHHRAQNKRDDMDVWLHNNDEAMLNLKDNIENEENKRRMLTLNGLETIIPDARGLRYYGNVPLEALWTIVKSYGNPSKAADGLKVYKIIYLYIHAAIYRDVALTQIQTALKLMIDRDCDEWPEGKCEELSTSDKADLESLCEDITKKFDLYKGSHYKRVAEYLEKVELKRSAVLVHHHPIGWSEESEFIHDFIVKYTDPLPTSYQSSWVMQPRKKFIVQPVSYPDYIVEPEGQNFGGNDCLELEYVTASDCQMNLAVEFEKLVDPDNKERNGYFMLKQNEYESMTSTSNWNNPRYWRFYKSPTFAWWLKLDLDASPSTIYTRVKTNSTNLANEYLFIVLEEEENDRTRCDEGTKPKVTIIAKRKRYDADMFITWKNWRAGGGAVGLSDGARLVPYETIADYTQFYIHDCQDSSSCPGCQSSTHKPTQTNTVENRKCNGPISPCPTFEDGDGYGHEEKIGMQSGEACIAACREKRDNERNEEVSDVNGIINGVTAKRSGGGCWCERNMIGVKSSSSTYKTCLLGD